MKPVTMYQSTEEERRAVGAVLNHVGALLPTWDEQKHEVLAVSPFLISEVWTLESVKAVYDALVSSEKRLIEAQADDPEVIGEQIAALRAAIEFVEWPDGIQD